MAKESMGIQKEGVAAMFVANANTKQIAGDMHRMVKLREEETALKKEEAAANRRGGIKYVDGQYIIRVWHLAIS